MATKILFDYQIFNSQKFGGISNKFCKLYNNLEKSNQAIQLLPIKYSENEHLQEMELFKNNIGNNSLFRSLQKKIIGKKRHHKHQVKFNNKLSLKALEKGDFDIFHPTYYDPYFLNKLNGKPFVIDVHDLTYQIFPEFFKLTDPIFQNMRLLVNRAAKIISVSNNTKQDLINIFQVDKRSIEVIHHGNPLEHLDINTISTNRSQNKLPESYLLFIGNRGGYKNFYFLIQAISEILLSNKNLKLVCSGIEFSNKELNFIYNIGLSKKIIHYKTKTDKNLATLYKNALAFIFPSLYEGFGLPILEAFFCGCPVILSKNSSFPEVAQDAAVYFNPKDYQSIKNAVSKVIDDKLLRDELIKKGYERLKEFSWKKCSEKTIQLYQSIL
jgi:glycosyltransferase involved in cell wall biosynthesis